MGLFDKLKNMKTDDDDAIALGVATGTTPEVLAGPRCLVHRG